MTKSKRPQDKWNEKNGYISKSYKLNIKTIEQFASACSAEGYTQAGQLTKLMNSYSISQQRRIFTMHIKEKAYADDKDRKYYNTLETIITTAIHAITEVEIAEKMAEVKTTLKGKPLFTTVNNTFVEYKEFYDQKELADFTAFDTSELIYHVKEKYLQQVALATLTTEGVIIPVTFVPQRYSTEINLKHRYGNKVFDLYLDLLPFTRFALIKKI